MNTFTNVDLSVLSNDQLSEIVGGNIAYDIGYGIGQISYVALEVLKFRRRR